MSMPSTAGRTGGGRTYVFGQHGGSDSTSKGVFYLKPGCGADVWSPSNADNAFMTVRLLPVRNPDNPTAWEPYRISPEPNAFGDWIRHFPACRKLGDPSVTFIYKDPRDESVDGQMTPGAILHRAIEARVRAKTDPGWGGYLQGSAGKSALLSRPSEVFLMQCVIVATNGQPKMLGANANDPVIVLALSGGVGKSLVEQLNRTREGYAGDMTDYPNSMAFGDPVSLQHGMFLTIYRKSDGDPRTRGGQNMAAQMPMIGGNRPAFGSGGNSRTEIGFDCFLEPTYAGMQANWSSYDSFFASRAKAWDEILYFPTVQEQAKLLADKFPADMIVYAWREHPDWIPEHVQRAAVAAHSVAMGGFGMPGGNPQFPQQQLPFMPQGAGFGPTPFGAPPMGAPQQPAGPAPGMPGMPAMPPMGMPGAAPGASGMPGAPAGFGAPQQPAFGAPQQQPFGMPQQPAGPAPFGAPGGFQPPAAVGAPPVGQPQPGFSGPPAFQPPAGFGAPPIAGQPAFGQPQQPQQPFPGQPGQAAAAPPWLGAGNTAAQPQMPQQPQPGYPTQPQMPQQPQMQMPQQPQMQMPQQPQLGTPTGPAQPAQPGYPTPGDPNAAQPAANDPMAALMGARQALGRG